MSVTGRRQQPRGCVRKPRSRSVSRLDLGGAHGETATDDEIRRTLGITARAVNTVPATCIDWLEDSPVVVSPRIGDGICGLRPLPAANATEITFGMAKVAPARSGDTLLPAAARADQRVKVCHGIVAHNVPSVIALVIRVGTLHHDSMSGNREATTVHPAVVTALRPNRAGSRARRTHSGSFPDGSKAGSMPPSVPARLAQNMSLRLTC